jgi:hypothetical protein
VESRGDCAPAFSGNTKQKNKKTAAAMSRINLSNANVTEEKPIPCERKAVPLKFNYGL